MDDDQIFYLNKSPVNIPFASPQGRPVEWQSLFWLAGATKIGAILGGSNYIAGRKKNVRKALLVFTERPLQCLRKNVGVSCAFLCNMYNHSHVVTSCKNKGFAVQQ